MLWKVLLRGWYPAWHKCPLHTADICMKLFLSTEDSWCMYDVIAVYWIADFCMKWLLSTDDGWYLYEVILLSTADSWYLYEMIAVYWRLVSKCCIAVWIADICFKLLLSIDDGWYLYEVTAAYWKWLISIWCNCCLLEVTNVSSFVATENSWYLYEAIAVYLR